MATHRADFSRLSLSQLSDLTGRSPETIRKRVDGLRPVHQDGRARYYNPREALPRIFGEEGLDLTAENARLAKERADAQALKNAELRGELVPASDQDAGLIGLATATQARILAVPAKVASECASETSPHGCQAIIERGLHDALNDLAEAGRRAAANVEERRSRAVRDAAAAEAERGGVGGAAEGAAAG